MIEDGCRRTLVVGVGNELMKDDGVGVHVVRELASRDFGPSIEIIDAGTVPDCWQAHGPVNKLIFIDAVHSDGEPGTVYRFGPEELEPEKGPVASVHQLSFLDGLMLCEIAGVMPDNTVIIGVEPKEVAWGTELSTELHDRLRDIIETVLRELAPERDAGDEETLCS